MEPQALDYVGVFTPMPTGGMLKLQLGTAELDVYY